MNIVQKSRPKRGIYLICFLIILVLGGFFFFSAHFLRNIKSQSLIAPVFGNDKIAVSDNIWFPEESSQSSQIDPLSNLTAVAAFAVDTQTGQILYSRNPHQQLPIASLTKIMTTIVALENKKLSDVFSVSATASEMEPDKMYLESGEQLTLGDLLNGIFLVSANDAAETIAEGATGDRAEFLSLMNQKSKALGMNDTLFINPSGLEEDGQRQYSSAYDVALMGRYLTHRWPEVINISSQDQSYLPATETHRAYQLYSGINLLTTYPGVVGLKTGYTPEAGLTLVTVARREGREVLGVLLNSTTRRDDARELLNYSFTQMGVSIP